jgi:nucleotide-binding universal stress UspA family protein
MRRATEIAMTLKTVLVPLFGDAGDRSSLAAAATLAKRFGAHLDVVHAERDPVDELPMTGAPLDPTTIELIFKDAEADIAEQAKAARKTFEDWSSKGEIRLASEPNGADGASASWIQLKSRAPDVVTRSGRLADLIVLPAPNGGDESLRHRATIEAALTDTGRPVLLVPLKRMGAIGKVIAVGWNGSAEAARAIAAAMPLLTQAERVVLLAAPQDGAGEDVAQLARSLAWHGIAADVHRFEAGDDVGAAIVEAASEVKADLLVIGAYSHSRIREMVFGGVTRHVLKGVDISVLLIH